MMKGEKTVKKNRERGLIAPPPELEKEIRLFPAKCSSYSCNSRRTHYELKRSRWEKKGGHGALKATSP